MMKKLLIFFILVIGTRCIAQEEYSAVRLPADLKAIVKSISIGNVGDLQPQVRISPFKRDVYYLEISWYLPHEVRQKEWTVHIKPNFEPTFHWAPHLTPTPNHIIAQHVFRAPAMIVHNQKKSLAIIPDVTLLQSLPKVDWYMDLDAETNQLTVGMAKSKITEHVLYEKDGTTIFPAGTYKFAAYMMRSTDVADISNPFAQVNSFMWEKWGEPLYREGAPLGNRNLDTYVDYTYSWAFNHWRNAVWQEFSLQGKQVGAPTFIVNVSQSPNYTGQVNEREFRSVWNQAWFNSLRSGLGLYRYAQRKGIDTLKNYALKTKELALAFPQKKGFFYGLIGTDMEEVREGDQVYWRSKGWSTLYFGNSNRNPFTVDSKAAPYHVLDMSYTAWLMLQWYTELEQDERLLDYAITYGDALINKQRADGYFPAWLDQASFEDLQVLSKSPESAMSVTFLLRLYELTRNEKYKSAALRAMAVIETEIVSQGKWEDFETYWSCSRFGHDHLVDKKIGRNNMYKQNTLSIYYTAQASLACYKVTKRKHYLVMGKRALDELLMWQAVWQPAFIYIQALGGFGVMNADAEWSDSRQSLFAELIMDYGQLLNRKDYLQRGLAALKASFVLMYCPENEETRAQWQSRWPFLGEADYGFMMENYGHDGVTSPDGIGIGEFTIYDWGNGAAAEAANRILDHWGSEILNGQ